MSFQDELKDVLKKDKSNAMSYEVKKGLGRAYRKDIEKRLRNAKTYDDYRHILMNFSSSEVKKRYSRALVYMEYHEKVHYSLEIKGEKISGTIELDLLSEPEFREIFMGDAPNEIAERVRRLNDAIFEESFLAGEVWTTKK